MIDYIDRLPDLWIRDCYACADEKFRLNIRVITEKPWSNLFAYNMFLRPGEENLDSFSPEWIVINVPGLKLNPKECGIHLIQRLSQKAAVANVHLPLGAFVIGIKARPAPAIGGDLTDRVEAHG